MMDADSKHIYPLIGQRSLSVKDRTVRASILFLTYNQQSFVADAAQSCLDQDCEPLEIIFSDDNSSDDTYVILEKVVSAYKGPHLVRVRKNARNLGIADHYNTLVKLAQGTLLITAAGDDISLPHRVRRILEVWDQSGSNLYLLASHAYALNFDGTHENRVIKVSALQKWTSPEKWCNKRPYVIGATHAFSKKLWDYFGEIASDIPYEDQVVTLRAVCLGTAVTIDEPLIQYRSGGVSSTQGSTADIDPKNTLRQRYVRQKTVFEQVRKDLDRADLGHLWKGKVKRYHTSAIAMLALINRTPANMQQFMGFALRTLFSCGPLWSLKVFKAWGRIKRFEKNQ